MEYWYRTLLLLAAVTLCTGTEDLWMRIVGPMNYTVKPGTSLKLGCLVNRDSNNFLLKQSIQWKHVSLATNAEGNPTNLTYQGVLTDKASPRDYDINVNASNMRVNFILTIKQLKPENDGIFRCVKKPLANGSTSQKAVQVIVVNNVEKVGVEFDGSQPITVESSTAVQREEGRYGVTCVAYGFNPSAVLQLFIGDELQEIGETRIDFDADRSEQAGARRYVARATASALYLKANHSNRRLKCVAQANFEGAVVKVASVPLSIIALEPVVKCDKNVSARVGDSYVKIACLVQHDNMEILHYIWEIGITGETVKIGATNDNYNEINVEKIDENSTRVTLDLFQVDKIHFDTIYYLDIYTSGGQKFREKAELIQLDPYPSSGRLQTGPVALFCLLSVVLSLLHCC